MVYKKINYSEVTWPIRKLGEVCDLPSPGIKEFEGKKRYVATADIDYDRITNFSKITYKNRPHRANVEVEENDVLVAKMAQTLKLLLATKEHQKDYIFSTGFAVLRAKEEYLVPSYLFYFLTTKDFNLQKDKLAVGATQKAINHQAFKRIKMPILPLKIQQEIVERLDVIRKAQELNDKQIALADELFQSLLWRELELKGKDWEVRRFGEISGFQYGYTAPAKELGEYRFIRITDIDDNGDLRNEDIKYINGPEKDLTPYFLKYGDLLVARTGATFGKILFFNLKEKSIFASYLIRLNINKKFISPSYLWLFSRTKEYWKQAMNLMTGSGQPQFNANKIKRIRVPVPPLKSQLEIIEKLQAVQDYKKKLLKQKQKLQELFESWLDKAMKGELVN